ncbi:MAG: DUF1127 domain-containing protein [Pseudorhodoplanes sp.]
MAAIHHFAPATTAPSVFASVVAALVTGLRAVSRALKNRRDAVILTGMDDRMLADIGLTRSDLRDAYAEPLWRDPTDVLAGRARDKRRYRGARHRGLKVVSPSLAPEADFTART